MTTCDRGAAARLGWALALAAGALGATEAASGADPPPPAPLPAPLLPAEVQDNELIFAAGGGGWAATGGDAAGGLAEAWVGLMNRALPWLDAELAAGVAAMIWDGALTQRSRGREASRAVLWGAGLRVSGRAHAPALGGLGLEAGARVGLFTAPLVGTLTRVELEVGASWDCWRDARTHGALSLLYMVPLWEGLSHEPGVDFSGQVQLATLRFSLGF